MFADPGVGKSYTFNSLILDGLFDDDDQFNRGNFGPSTTGDQVHTEGVTRMALRAVPHKTEFSISIKASIKDPKIVSQGPSMTISPGESLNNNTGTRFKCILTIANTN